MTPANSASPALKTLPWWDWTLIVSLALWVGTWLRLCHRDFLRCWPRASIPWQISSTTHPCFVWVARLLKLAECRNVASGSRGLVE